VTQQTVMIFRDKVSREGGPDSGEATTRREGGARWKEGVKQGRLERLSGRRAVA
jgi:hypothetical protein